MENKNISELRVAVLATDGFEESELTEPVRALRERGARVDIISPRSGKIQGFQHHDKGVQIHVNRTLDEAKPDEYDALLLPGGALNADALRAEPAALAFARAMNDADRPMAIICHAPWLLVSADIVRGRTMTSYSSIQTDLRNAGANWVDQEVVVDRNWVMSRQPKDLPAFIREIFNVFPRGANRATNAA